MTFRDRGLASIGTASGALERKPRILIVDDQPTNIQVVYQILCSNYELYMAKNGPEALEICQNIPMDLVLLDVMLPEMDGFEVCERLKKKEFTVAIPVIFITAMNAIESEVRALEVGGVDFISKPINSRVLRARVSTHISLKLQTDYLRSLSMIDGLTGLPNRRRFDDELSKQWRFCLRNSVAISLVMIDVDYFKNFNDCYGHIEGGACLQAIARELNGSMRRPHDLVARYGGEEFAALLPDTDAAGARNLAESLWRGVERLGIPHARSLASPSVSISIGIASRIPDPESTGNQLIRSADQALYAAKAAGRNRVCIGPT